MQMSNPNPQTIHAAIAQHLAHPTILSIEEKLFQDALRSVENERRAKGDLPKAFDNLNHAKSVEDVKLMLESERASSKLWQDSLARSWIDIFSKYAEIILCYKGLLDKVVSRTGADVAAPIWGSIEFVLSVVKDLGVTKELIAATDNTLRTSIRRFKHYVDGGKKLSPNLQDCLLFYYKKFLDLAIDIHKEFSKSFAVASSRAIHRFLKRRLESFNSDIHHIIDDVDKAADIDSRERVESDITVLKIASTNQPQYSIPISQVAVSRSHGLAPPSHYFTGQRQYLRAIWNMLNNPSGQPSAGRKKAAVYGMGGIGKTQILLQYARDLCNSGVQPSPYDTIIWINATNDTTIRNAISSFMDVNGFRESLTDDQGNPRYTPFYARLRQHCKHWLLIFDNVCNYNHVKKALPPEDSTGHLLFSTRHKLVAEMVAPLSQNVEILPMDEDTATELVLRLAKASEQDDYAIPNDAAREIAKFTRGLPLMIEQLVNNAVFSRRSLSETLESVRQKTELLRQQNVSSLHEDDLSLGGMIMQTFETLKSRNPAAEALFKILAYLEPSSIPLSLFEDAAVRLNDFCERQTTFSQGAVQLKDGILIDRKVLLHVPQTIDQKDTSHRRRLSPFRRSRSGRKTEPHAPLPVDDIESTRLLREVCGPDSVLAKTFNDPFTLDIAVRFLVDLAILRQPNANELWMHDLTSQVAKALISSSITSGQSMCLAAATMVYMAFPTPLRGMAGNRRTNCRKYLSHAISCHSNLKDCGILNDSSIGPELSHIIASTLHDDTWIGKDISGQVSLEQQQVHDRARVVAYYRDALQGYMAGWQRLKIHNKLSDEEIFLHIRADRRDEENLQPCYMDRYVRDYERLGCNAPWRALQNLCKLSATLESDAAMTDQGLSYTRTALKFYTLVFGSNHEDTVSIKTMLYRQLSNAGRWQEAYTVAMQGVKDFIGWYPDNDQNDEKTLYKSLAEHPQTTEFTRQLGHACMTLSEDPSLSQPEVQKFVNEAVMWYEIKLRNLQITYGDEEHYCCRVPMTQYAEALERAGRFRAALYWYGRAVFCSLSTMMWEHEHWTDGPGWGKVLPGNESAIRETVTTFENAMIKLLQDGDGNLGKMENLDVDFQKFLMAVEGRIWVWRTDREQFGVWDLDAEEADKTKEEQEAEEARIRAEEEKIYGKIPDLWDPNLYEEMDRVAERYNERKQLHGNGNFAGCDVDDAENKENTQATTGKDVILSEAADEFVGVDRIAA